MNCTTSTIYRLKDIIKRYRNLTLGYQLAVDDQVVDVGLYMYELVLFLSYLVLPIHK